MKKSIMIFAVISLVLISGISYAQGSFHDKTKNFRPLEKRVFIHYKNGFAKPPWAGGGNKNSGGSSCYSVLSKGMILKGEKSLTISPDLDALAIMNGATEWDLHTSNTIFSGYSIDPTANWDDNSPDGRNEMSLGNYPQAGVIAVTVTWGYFSGPPQTREITEFDILFDTDYQWGNADLNSALMDEQNIATHEIGHGIGLDDIYDSGCGEVTMYGYSQNGETKKRTIEAQDIEGLIKLYGI